MPRDTPMATELAAGAPAGVAGEPPEALPVGTALRLAAWLSPSFPIGAFSYSHAIERAVELGTIDGEASLGRWIRDVLHHGAGRSDAVLFACAWRQANSRAAFLEVAQLAAALRPTRELALEAQAQGEAFLRTITCAWPSPQLARIVRWLAHDGTAPVLPIAVAAACRAHDLPLHGSLALYLHAFAANLVSAGIRLVPLGQLAGQRITAALEAEIPGLADDAWARELHEVGSVCPSLEILSMQHEQQYTRLFRS